MLPNVDWTIKSYGSLGAGAAMVLPRNQGPPVHPPPGAHKLICVEGIFFGCLTQQSIPASKTTSKMFSSISLLDLYRPAMWGVWIRTELLGHSRTPLRFGEVLLGDYDTLLSQPLLSGPRHLRIPCYPGRECTNPDLPTSNLVASFSSSFFESPSISDQVIGLSVHGKAG